MTIRVDGWLGQPLDGWKKLTIGLCKECGEPFHGPAHERICGPCVPRTARPARQRIARGARPRAGGILAEFERAARGVLAIPLAGACSNPQAGAELRRMARAAADIERETPRSEPAPDRYAPPSPRPGWVTGLVIRVLAGSDRALSPHDVHRRAELVQGNGLLDRRSVMRCASARQRRTRPSSAWLTPATDCAPNPRVDP